MIRYFARRRIFSRWPTEGRLEIAGNCGLVLPAAFLAAVTALGLMVEAWSHSAQARFRTEAWSSAAAPAGIELAKLTPAHVDLDEELTCLALNIYFEARNEPYDGKIAVGHVVMNRITDPQFPETICAVVRQGGERRKHRCQFSWWCDGRSDRPGNMKAWEFSKAVAARVYWGPSADPTSGALWYHADYVKPYWRRAFNKGPKIGRHIFYTGKERVQVASQQ